MVLIVFDSCFHVFWPVWACSDLFGPIRTYSDLFRPVRKRSETFGNMQTHRTDSDVFCAGFWIWVPSETYLKVFGSSRACLDLFLHVWMHSGMFGCIRTFWMCFEVSRNSMFSCFVSWRNYTLVPNGNESKGTEAYELKQCEFTMK